MESESVREEKELSSAVPAQELSPMALCSQPLSLAARAAQGQRPGVLPPSQPSRSWPGSPCSDILSESLHPGMH